MFLVCIMTRMKLLVIFVIISCLILGLRSQQHLQPAPWNNWNLRNTYKKGSVCYTPDIVLGSCIELSNCPSLYNPLTPRIYLERSHQSCGEEYLEDSPLVCCGPNPLFYKTALMSAERCRNSKSETGVCIPQKMCESLSVQNRFPVATPETCDEENTLICCTTLQTNFDNEIKEPESEANSVKFLSMEEGCGETFIKKRVKRIIGGQTSKVGNWPWIALIGYADDVAINFRCGGVLITDRHVLTAAHCYFPNKKLFVRLGEHDLSTNEESDHIDINVSEVYPHPGYNREDFLYDIAVFRLSEAVKFTEYISPICMPTTPKLQELSHENAQAHVTGWGSTMEKGSGATILQNIQVQVYNNSVCKNLYKQINAVVSEKQFGEVVLCTADMNSGMDACRGDSGGPVMVPTRYGDGERFVLIGLVSYGIGCGRKNIPSVNANVINLMSWIKERVAEMS